MVEEIEAILATVAKLFAMDGAAKEVAILANANPFIAQTTHDGWNGGMDFHSLHLRLPIYLYGQLGEDKSTLEKTISDKIASLIPSSSTEFINEVTILPELSTDSNWRDKANAWLTGSNVSNQGRVRSDNIASRNCDGLLFRSQPEIHFYKAMKAVGVSFAPLPVFIKGGESYKRIEPDFVLIKDGVMMVVEIDGDTVHQETPAEAHARTTMLLHEGVHFERIVASECDTEEKAKVSVKKILEIFNKLKAHR